MNSEDICEVVLSQDVDMEPFPSRKLAILVFNNGRLKTIDIYHQYFDNEEGGGTFEWKSWMDEGTTLTSSEFESIIDGIASKEARDFEDSMEKIKRNE